MSNELIKKAYEHFGGVWPSEWSEFIYSTSSDCKLGVCLVDHEDMDGEYKKGDIRQVVAGCDDSLWRAICDQEQFYAYGKSLKSDQEINWGEAPEGATAYCDSSGYSWLKKDSNGEVSFYNEDRNRWQLYATPSKGVHHHSMAVKRPVETKPWMPEVGVECEVEHYGLGWLVGECIAYDKSEGVFVFKTAHGYDGYSKFRPIKTERDQLIEVIDSCNLSSGVLADAILNAGYRKADGE